MYTVFLLIVGSVLFVIYVFVSGFCIVEMFESLFKSDKFGSGSKFVSQVRQFEERDNKGRNGDVGGSGSVYVKNLGVKRGKPQQDGPKRIDTLKCVVPVQNKQEQEKLMKANAARQAAIALNKQMRRDKFGKCKW
ncbi:hypothetical protein [Borrelia sp. RT1S]|uniref:hypothetical protein n=1 Tax=Borrelia sp. RT1S TaxID=2898580 RepID=UPI001E410415|nr:hypothetical protein [Borrelia sp. RT1S]UGQ17629.1 hypothetical protein LSO05_04470 [Borrelia sp. RT1S]